MVLVVALIFCRSLYLIKSYVSKKQSSKIPNYRYPPNRNYDALYKTAWKELAQSLEEARPIVASVGNVYKHQGVSLDNADNEQPTEIIRLAPKHVVALKISHARFVRDIQHQKMSTVYQDGRRGIVVTADWTSIPAILVQLRLLRRTECKLPVEVFFLDDSDYDKEVCLDVLPKLGASCRSLESFLSVAPMPSLPETTTTRKVKANEPLHKYLSIFFSSFEDVLLLDPSTLVYNNPDYILREEPYLSSGMILWPDFWLSSVSPTMQKIQDKPLSPRSDNIRTIDMGQIVISKSEQSGALLLAIYYTYFGEQLYDTLLQQSSAGELGSQAIKTAAKYLESSYYLVRRHVEAIGYPNPDNNNEFRGVAMLQSFPLDDYHRLPKERHRPVFIKAHNPPLNPADVMKAGVTHFKVTNDGEVNAHRMWEWFSARHTSNGWRDPDPERALWEEMSRVACTDSQHIQTWSAHGTGQCQDIDQYRKDVAYGHF